ncbi:hypothetical protein CRYUN_Cryun03dG0122900 [Craigia yunnanensis]
MYKTKFENKNLNQKLALSLSPKYIDAVDVAQPTTIDHHSGYILFQALSEMGAETNGAEQTPTETMQETIEELLEAAQYDDIEDLIRLASVGVSLDSKDSQGRTVLHMAAANGHLDIVEYLIGSGVDVNASNVENNTPLHWACLNGHVEINYCCSCLL